MELKEALEKSRNYWLFLASVADAQRDYGILPDFVDPRNSLGKVPRFQARPGNIFLQAGRLVTESSSIWKVSNSGDCDEIKGEVEKRAFMTIGQQVCGHLKLDGQVFSKWVGTTEEISPGANYIGILTLAWCYILSARLIELRGDGASLQYTNYQAQYDDRTDTEFSATSRLDIGKVDDDVARWWSAILAPMTGWDATVKMNYVSRVTPWSVSRGCENTFSINHMAPEPESVLLPLSSQRAFEALSEFALLHELGSQFPISLATALMIPTHSYFKSVAHLPSPIMKERKEKSIVSTSSMPQAWLAYMSDMDYYMSLSCDPERMMAILCGPLWEPEVPCNLVSPWLHPVLNEIIANSSEATAHDQETLSLLCALRRPSIGALCIGAAMSGLSQKIMSRAQLGNLPVEQHGFPWTRSPQSFHDMSGVGPYMNSDSKTIMRQDVCRLLHLPTTDPELSNFEARPFGGWAPFGKSNLENCDLQVVSHLNCRRHEYQYDHWRWLLEDGYSFNDYGFSRDLTMPVPKGLSDMIKKAIWTGYPEKEFDNEQEASRDASYQSFFWLCQGGGIPLESAYHDDWIREAWSSLSSDNDTEKDEEVESDFCGNLFPVESWVASVSSSL